MVFSGIGSVLLLLCVAVASAALILLPDLASRKADVEELLSQRTHLRVQVGSLAPHWDFLHPGVRARDVRIGSPATGAIAMGFEEVRVSVSWLPLITGHLTAHRLVIVGPRLAFERLPSGLLSIRGLDATGSATPAEQEAAVRALFRVGDIGIENGELRWFDTRANEPPLALSDVDLRLRNDGDRHRFELTARFPDALCRACEFTADVRGNPFAENPDWDGELFVRAQALDVARLPALVREFLPAGLHGIIDVRASSEWRAARPMRAEGKLRIADFHVPVPDFAPIEAHEAEATLRWKAWDDAKHWRLELDDLRVGLTRSVWDAGKLKLVRDGDSVALAMDHVRLDDISRLAERFADAHAFMRVARDMKARGWLDGFEMTLNGPLGALADIGARGTLRAVSWQPRGRVPGIEDLSGSFRFDAQGGEASLSTGRGVLAMPRVFEANLDYDQLTARAHWKRTDRAWEVRLDNLSALTPDGRAWASTEIFVPRSGDAGVRVKLRADVANANGAHAARYFPLILNAKLRAWLGNAIRAGNVTRAQVIFDGPVRAFPFRGGEGKFEVGFHVRDGVFEYLPDWPLLEAIETDVTFRDFSMAISADRARIQDLRVGPVVVAIPDLGARDATVVQIGGEATGTVDALIGALRRANLHRYTRHLAPALRAAGSGDLKLSIHFPTHTPHALRVNGKYRVHDASLLGVATDVDLTALDGEVVFSEVGPIGGGIAGQALGGKFDVRFQPQTDGDGYAHALVQASGTATATALRPWLGVAAPYLSGIIPWQLRLTPSEEKFALQLDADLRALHSDLPAPFAKPVGEPLHASLRTTRVTPEEREFALTLGERLHGALRFTPNADGSFEFERGQTLVGAPANLSAGMPSEPGLQLAVRLPTLDIAPWLPILKGKVTMKEAGAAPAPSPLIRVTAQLGQLTYGESNIGRFDLDLRRLGATPASVWSGRVGGELASGVVEWRTGEQSSSLKATLERLSVPLSPGGQRAPAAVKTRDARAGVGNLDPGTLPAVTVSSQELNWHGRRVGSLEFRAGPANGQWRIESLRLAEPHYTLAAEGEWIVDAAGNRTRLRAQMEATDFGAFLASMGASALVRNGEMQAQSSWEWPGPPYDFALARLSGTLTLDASHGRLPSVNEGAGRLFGVFDLRALPRYLQLDFSSIFAKGFAFDSMTGALSVTKGDATINSALVKGPAADISVTGRVGLVARDFGLSMQVSPRLGEGPTIAGALLGGPVGAAAVAVAKGVFKKPLAAGTRQTYDVTGSWDTPHIERRRESSAPNPPGEPAAQP